MRSRRHPGRLIALAAIVVLAVGGLVALGIVVVGGFGGAAAQVPATASTPIRLPAAPKVVTIGDSIMSGLGVDGSQAWPALVASASGADISNLGCSGAGFIAQGDCGQNYDGIVPDAVALHPDLVIIQSSDNDIGESAADIRAATTSTVEALHAQLPGAQIIAFGTLWNQPTAAPDEIATSSVALRDATRAVGGTFLDLGQPLQGDPALLQWDDEHPTVEGQRVLAQTVQSVLADVGVVL